MKKIFISLLTLSLISCNHEKINTNLYGVTDYEYKQGDITYGAALQGMQQNVVRLGSPSLTTDPGNQYHAVEILGSGSYIGFFGNNNNWNNSIEATWTFPDNRMSYIYETLYKGIYQDWLSISEIVKGSTEPKLLRIKAVADLIRIIAWSRTSDVFGPIIYSEAGKGNISPKLDSQEKVYEQMLSDLETIRDILNSSNASIVGQYDIVYSGVSAKWCKLANSIMLRLAVRSHFVNENLARTYIEKALDPSKGGVMEEVSDEAKVGASPKLELLNPMIASIDYGETRMGLTIWSYLTGYEDGRIAKYFQKGTYDEEEGYYAIAPVNIYPKRPKEWSMGPFHASKPLVENGTPVYWMRASEVYFLRAEAALYGFTGEDAKNMYETGVKTSFEEWGVQGASQYLAKANLPKDVKRGEYKYGLWKPYSCSISEGNVSPSWDDVTAGEDAKEKHLQKIMTQKYLALYPNAVEAWTEYRRTGYPFLMRPYDKNAYSRIGGTANMLTPERLKFASTEYNVNQNMNNVPELLKGEDNGATKLWWVRSDRPQQPK